jgi:CRISPR-associated endonuclease/helicase Cas3
VSDDASVEVKLLRDFAEKDTEELLYGRTILLPPSIGGLSERGLLDGKAPAPEGSSLDVADIVDGPDGKPLRRRIRSATTDVPHEHRDLRLVRMIDTLRDDEELNGKSEEALTTRYWLWLEAPKASGADSLRNAGRSIPLDDHSHDVEAHARAIVEKLKLPSSLAQCVILAARFHDLGKRRLYWQRGIGNMDATRWLAKAGPELRPRLLAEPYRHEFGSLLDAEKEQAFRVLPPDEKDLLLHLIAAHHGRGRPHFPTEESFDPDAAHANAQHLAAEVPCRFARLQRRFGRWGIAYLESLLRAADYAASAGIEPLSEPTS